MSPLLGLWVLMSAHGHSWALISSGPWLHKRSLVLVRANGPLAVCSWQLLSSPLVLIAPWRQVHENSWLLMSAHEQSWVLMSTQQHSWALISSQEQLWVLMIVHEHLWPAMNTHQLGAMEQWALMSMASWGLGPSLALLLPKHYNHEFMIPNEHSWELRSAHEH